MVLSLQQETKENSRQIMSISDFGTRIKTIIYFTFLIALEIKLLLIYELLIMNMLITTHLGGVWERLVVIIRKLFNSVRSAQGV